MTELSRAEKITAALSESIKDLLLSQSRAHVSVTRDTRTPTVVFKGLSKSTDGIVSDATVRGIRVVKVRLGINRQTAQGPKPTYLYYAVGKDAVYAADKVNRAIDSAKLSFDPKHADLRTRWVTALKASKGNEIKATDLFQSDQ